MVRLGFVWGFIRGYYWGVGLGFGLGSVFKLILILHTIYHSTRLSSVDLLCFALLTECIVLLDLICNISFFVVVVVVVLFSSTSNNKSELITPTLMQSWSHQRVRTKVCGNVNISDSFVWSSMD